MKTLDEIRVMIDEIDEQIKTLIMKRLDCSKMVVESKIADENYVIYRADREVAMLERLGADVPDDRREGYQAIVKKITEISRMYQYGILYNEVTTLFTDLIKGMEIPKDCAAVKVRLTRPNIPNGMSAILCMVGDYGYDMREMKLIEYSKDQCDVTFELVMLGNLNEEHMKTLMLELSMESKNFEILELESV